MKRKFYLLMTALLVGLTAWAQAPKADILDVVFNDDGTATDVSELQNEVYPVGEPYVVKSTKYGMNVACFRNNLWGSTPKGYFRVDYAENDEFQAALAESHTFEALIRPLVDPKEYDATCKFFSNQQSGGGNLYVGGSSRNYEICYCDWIGQETQYVQSGISPVPGTYYHVVGVWDKDYGIISIYVNGELCGEEEVDGSYKGPVEGSEWFSIGSDPSTKGNSTNAFSGDIAIARIYGKALEEADVKALYAAVQAKDTGAAEHVDEQEYDPYISMPGGSVNNMTCEPIEGEAFAYHLESIGDDPYMYWNPIQKDLGEEQTVITFEYKSSTGSLGSEFFFSPIAGGREISFDLAVADDWTTFYFDLSSPIAGYSWGKAGDFLRLDLANQAGIILDIRNIHFITKKEYLEAIGGNTEITLTKDAEGYYLVNTPEDLAQVAHAVNVLSMNNINVRLTEDLDLSGEVWTPIGAGPTYNKTDNEAGVTNPGFAGIFDGQGHTVSNFVITMNDAVGLFGVVTGTVKNVGVIGLSYQATADCRAGGIAGTVTATASSVGLVENCFVMNSSILTTERVCGGLVGAVCGGTVRNCFTANNELSGYGERFGGIAGDTKNDNGWVGIVENCYTDFARVTSSQVGTTIASEANVSADRFASGEITYKMNGSTTTPTSAWRQNINEDAYPVLDTHSGFVMPVGNEFISFTDDSFEGVRDEIYSKEFDYNESVICLKVLNENYEAMLNAFGEATTVQDFFTLFGQLNDMKAQLASSAAAYAAYQAKIDYINAYLEENGATVIGKEREQLDAYLKEMLEPNETYPNGSYPYIIDTRELDNDALSAETDFAQKLLDFAISGGYTPGTDISNLIVNGDLSQGTKGWTIENASLSISNVGGAGVPYIGYSNGRIRLSQTITDLKPGFYLVKVNAAYRAAGDNANMNQTAFVFANGKKVYVPTLREGIIPGDSESANLDKYDPVEDEFGEFIGYQPNSTNALAFAFGDGYYENAIVAEVGEDGALTLGVQTLGCNRTNETWVGDFHLTYCGAATTDFADAAFEEAQVCQLSRLNTVANNYECDSFDYMATPNYSQALRDEAAAAVENGPADSNQLEKITALGDLMQEIYDCKQAYAAMMSKAETTMDLYTDLIHAGLMTEYDDEAKLMIDGYSAISDAYLDGTYSLEEALAADAFNAISFMPSIEDNMVKISNSKELILFSALVNSGFYASVNAVLLNDIDLQGGEWRPIGIAHSYNKTEGPSGVTNPGYAGTFDGQGHVVSNFTILEGNETDAVGFFGVVTGTVKNLGIDNAYFEATMDCRAGGIAGTVTASETSEGLVENCFVKNSSILTKERVCGGVAGAVCGGTVRNCYGFKNSLSGHSGRFGGIAGDTQNDMKWVGVVENCYTDFGSVTSSQAGTTTACEGGVSASRFAGGEIAYKLNGGATAPEEVIWYQTIMEDNSPVLDNTHYIVRLTENGAYSNFDDTNAALIALVQEAQGLSSTLKMTGGEPLITSGDQLSDNCLWQAGFEIQTIIDGEQSTYFHSRIDTPLENGTEYFQVNLASPVTGFYIEYTGRSDGAPEKNWHDTPDKIRIMATNTPENESSWVETSVEDYTGLIPNENGAHYKSETPIKLGGNYQYIRFYILHATSNNPYWNITEFQMYSIGEAGTSIYDTNGEIKAAVDEMDAVAEAKLALVKKGAGTQADIDELQALVDVVRSLSGIAKPHTGTKNDPYEIATAEDFVDLHNKMHTGETTYVILTADIDMSAYDNWMPLNDATNTADGKSWMNWLEFDGKGHVVSNLSCHDYEYASVFGVFCGHVYNVGFENVNIVASSTGSGALGGYMGHSNYADAAGNKYSSSFENVWVTGKLNVSSAYCGGIVGNIGGPSTIKNCYTNLEITSEATYVGGIVGRVRDALTMQNVYAAGTINTGGGILGGGQNASTPASTYTNCVVWNNATEFGTLAEGDTAEGISYYDGSNFAALQQLVVGWGDPWTCGMAAGEYPTFNKELLTGIQQIALRPATTGNTGLVNIYTLDGRLVKAQTPVSTVKSLPKGLYIVGGRKVVVK